MNKRFLSVFEAASREGLSFRTRPFFAFVGHGQNNMRFSHPDQWILRELFPPMLCSLGEPRRKYVLDEDLV